MNIYRMYLVQKGEVVMWPYGAESSNAVSINFPKDLHKCIQEDLGLVVFFLLASRIRALWATGSWNGDDGAISKPVHVPERVLLEARLPRSIPVTAGLEIIAIRISNEAFLTPIALARCRSSSRCTADSIAQVSHIL